MSLAKTLDKLEEQYYGELEEDREAVIAELYKLHTEALSKGPDAFRKFSEEARNTCGGVYIPYLMWVELANFLENEADGRDAIYELVGAFVESDFEETETKKMKSLLITYFALEREFEVNKVQTLIVGKSHPQVQEYFRKLQNFVERNKTSVDMYVDKFRMLAKHEPDFSLLKMPVIKLKEHLGIAG